VDSVLKVEDEPVHQQIDQLEEAMLSVPEALIDCPLEHRFTPGLYIRTIFNPKGTLLTTKIHKTEHPFVLLQGHISVYVPGEEVKHLTAPYIAITKPGTRRIIYAHEDSIVSTVHANPYNCKDLDILEERMIERRELRGGKSTYELSQELMQKLLQE